MTPEQTNSRESISGQAGAGECTPPGGSFAPGTQALIGQVIGPYRIQELIGEGGMGAVYRALDERLDRVVAIKTLLVQHAAEPDLVQRMYIEARSASALSHPNICTIFDVGEWEGRPYIVMEYLEGDSLRSRINSRPLPLEELLKIGIQLSAALEAAHAKRIIHRDVKPGNLFLTTAGPMKIMDFGVAKRIRRVAEPEPKPAPTVTESLDLTNPGTTVGTVSYMSPEQARGEALDVRTDLFSAGAVLYEMATGQKPYQGATVALVLDAILNRDPKAPSAINPSIPADLDRIILKALDKDRSLRYQSASDMGADLRRLQRDASSGRITAVNNAAAKPNRAWPWLAAALVLIGGAAWMLWRQDEKQEAARIVSLGFRGIKDNPVISGDGERVAFAWTGEKGDPNEKEIYVHQFGSGTPLKVTDGPGRAETPVWSADGRQIAYLRMGAAGSGYYAIPALGGLERKLAPAIDPPPRNGGASFDWSPDGKHMVIADRSQGDGKRDLFLVDLASGSQKELGVKDVFVASPVYSPDGKWIAFVRGPSFLSHDIHVMPAAGGAAKRLTTDGRWVAGISWTSDGKNLVFSSRRGGPFRLWTIPAAGGAVAPVALSGTDAYFPHIARKTPRLVYVLNKVNKTLWRMKMGENGADAKEIISSTRISFQPDYSPDGTRIAYASDSTGAFEIFVSDQEGHSQMQLTHFEGAQTGSPHWSPDGKAIAFDSRPDGHADVYVMSMAGGEARRLTKEASEDRTPFWSADGKWIYFTSNRSGQNEIWRVPAEGGQAEPISRNGAISGTELNGEIYYANLTGLWKSPGSLTPEQVTAPFPRVGWIAHKGNFYFARPDAKGLVEIVQFRPSDKRMMVVARPGHKPSDFDTFAISPDGQWLMFDRVNHIENEIMLVDNFR